jgi:hypothetical protein
VGNLEPKPGLPASAAHLAELLEQLKGKQVAVIIRSVYEDGKASNGSPRTSSRRRAAGRRRARRRDLFGMFDVIVKTLLEAHP